MDYLCSKELERNLYHIFYHLNLSLIARLLLHICIYKRMEEEGKDLIKI